MSTPPMRRFLRARSLLFSLEGRIARSTFWATTLALALGYLALLPSAELLPAGAGVVALDLVLLWLLFALAVKRLHDRARSAWFLLVAVIPLLGPLALLIELGLRKGTPGENQYGDDPTADRSDYLEVEPSDPETGSRIVEEVTRLYPTEVFAVATPRTVDEVREALARTTGAVSIGGGRFSMGGQVASPGSLHLDMRRMNRVLELSLEKRTIRVQAGTRWCDVQRVVDPHGLAVAIMQSYANFTVGGSIGVNVHGRYVGRGPLVQSVRSLTLVLADGSVVRASRDERPEIFFGAIGGYGALGVVVEVELELAENTRMEEIAVKLPVREYAAHFRDHVKSAEGVVLHNADLYAPHYASLRSVTWVATKRPVTHADRLMPTKPAYPLQGYLAWAVSETPFGKQRREYLIDPIRFLTRRVHWRNYEAGYDVAELEPPSRAHRTYVLQEYFVPVGRFDEFVPRMAEILQRHEVNVLNISVRHATPDDGTYLAWAREEVFAFVLYYKQRTRKNARSRVAVWTRELIDAALACGGAYYLPYQAHATEEQFHAAYPRAAELFELKRALDPGFRFRNVLWDQYYAPWLERHAAKEAAPAEPETDTLARVSLERIEVEKGEHRAVFGDTHLRDDFYRFLQVVYHLYPEDRFHQLLADATEKHAGDEAIYRAVQEKLPEIRPFLAPLRFALPALAKQKHEMARQTAELLRGRASIDGYLEIGTTGRYVNAIRRHVPIRGPVVLVNDVAPGSGPVDVIERGQLAQVGRFVPLDDYAPIPEASVPSESFDVVSCFIGLHHAAPEDLEPFVRSIHRVLRPGGVFVLRDHDVVDASMDRLVSLAHTVFNAGLGAPWKVNAEERRHFAPVAEWSRRLEALGFRDTGARLLQANDPTDNVLMAFVKPGAEPARAGKAAA